MAFHTCDEIQAFKEAFDAFDWNKSGTISYKSLQVKDHADADADADEVRLRGGVWQMVMRETGGRRW